MTKRTKNRLASIHNNLEVAFNEIVENEPIVAARLVILRQLLQSIENDELWNLSISAITK